MKIIQFKKNKDIFDNIFIKTENGFDNMNELIVALRKIKSYRDAISHGRQPKLSSNDEELLKIYIKKINEIIRNLTG